jgi:hypothetical protein
MTIFVLSLKHYDRSQRKMEGQSKVIRLFFYIKKGRALCVHLGFAPHHNLRPTKNLNQYKGTAIFFEKQIIYKKKY